MNRPFALSYSIYSIQNWILILISAAKYIHISNARNTIFIIFSLLFFFCILQGTALVICGLLLSEAFAVSILNETPVNTHANTHQKIAYFSQVMRISPQAAKVGVDLCPTCINFTGQAIDMLLNIILRKSLKYCLIDKCFVVLLPIR